MGAAPSPGLRPADQIEAVRAHLTELCSSGALARSQRSQALLRYLVEAWLEGRGPAKEYTLGAEVFERGESFDPKVDSVVRTEVNRLRARIEKYYEEAPPARFRIELARGEYAVNVAPVPNAPVMASPAAATGNRSRWPVLAALTLFACGLIGWMMVWRPARKLTTGLVYRSELLPPEGGVIDPDRGFAMAPVGRMVAFVGISGGQSGLWVRSMDAAAPRKLAGTAGARDPFWSPDGQSIAYAASARLWRMRLDESVPVAICDAPSVNGGAWTSNGDIIFSTGSSGLRRVSAAGGPVEAFSTPDAARGETSHRWPELLPEGGILFQVMGARAIAGAYAAPLANPRDRARVLDIEGNASFAAGHLLWLRDSTLVAQPFDPVRRALSGEARPIADSVGAGTFGRMLAAASSSELVHARAGGDQLTWTDAAGKVTGVTGPPGGYLTFRLSPDGKRIAASRASGRGADLWIIDVERNASGRLTFLSGGVGFPVWSPDGRQVMFRAGSPRNLYRKEASGAGGEQQVTRSPNPQWPSDWSRDGRALLYYENAPDTHRDLWVLPVTPEGNADARAKAYPYLRTRFNEFNGRFSPEPSPRWVAYESDESGVHEVYAREFPEAKGKWQISAGGGSSPEWSPDGRELYYLSASGKLMAVSLATGPDSVAPSAPRELFSLPSRAALPRYGVGREGGRFLTPAPVGGSQPMALVVNWPALLRPDTPR